MDGICWGSKTALPQSGGILRHEQTTWKMSEGVVRGCAHVLTLPCCQLSYDHGQFAATDDAEANNSAAA